MNNMIKNPEYARIQNIANLRRQVGPPTLGEYEIIKSRYAKSRNRFTHQQALKASIGTIVNY